MVDPNGTPIVDTSRTFDGTLTVNDKLNYDGTTLQPEWYRLVNGRLESVNPSTLQISKHGTIYVPVWNYPTKTLNYNANGGANPPTTSDLKFKENIAIADPGAMTPPKEGLSSSVGTQKQMEKERAIYLSMSFNSTILQEVVWSFLQSGLLILRLIK